MDPIANLPAASGGEKVWHALEPAAAAAALASPEGGLTEAEAARRAALAGPNLLRPPAPVAPWRVLGNQLRGVVPALFAATALVSALLGETLESAAVGAVLLLDVAIGFATELRAHRAMHQLSRLQARSALVRRGGRERRIDAAELVPGDLLALEAGAAVAADARLLAASELRLIEAPLTGESFPVAKSIAAVPEAAPLAERSSMVYRGTMVAAGSGLAMVTATGGRTEVGRIAELVEAVEVGKTPLEGRIETVGRYLVAATLAIAALAALFGVSRGGDPMTMVQLGLALAIAAVPEGLPVVATVVLAVGLHRMAGRRALVRRLMSVETLGSTTVICTDKTGTLTAGQMTLARLEAGGVRIELSGRGYFEEGELRRGDRPASLEQVPGLLEALEAGALANRARLDAGSRQAEGDPTELALLAAAAKAGLDRARLRAAAPELAELPFSSERMLMATFHRQPDGRLLICAKGAPARLLERCASWMSPSGERPLDAAARARLMALNDEMAGAGLRVLALARRIGEAAETPGEEALRGLVWLAAAGIEDPEVEGVAETVAALQAAGIRLIMLTGDQALTAAAVARRLGILAAGGETLEGRDLAGLAPAELAVRLRRAAVLGRLAPADKLRIVEALQLAGETVAMIGDGINDGPALRRADVGVALGLRGTDVAKETAAMVLADDRLPTLVEAVEQGRATRDNVEKALAYLFTCNLAEVLVLGAFFFDRGAPALMPLQILWLNLATDVFPALALAMEPAERDVMRRGPRPNDGQLLPPRRLVRIATVAALLAAATIGAYTLALARGAGGEAARTTAFLALGFGQLFLAWDARSRAPVLFRRGPAANRFVWAAVAASAALLAAVVFAPPLAAVFGTPPPGRELTALAAGAAFLPFLAAQLGRLLMPPR